jgi:hypothetical protein
VGPTRTTTLIGGALALTVGLAPLCAAAGVNGSPLPPTGDPAGVALARHVAAAYRVVPGMRFEISTRLDGSPAHIVGYTAFRRGRPVGQVSTITTPRATVTLLEPRGPLSYVRTAGTACWRAVPAQQSGSSTTIVSLPGSRFEAPRRRGSALVLRALERVGPGQLESHEYLVDPRSFLIRSVRNLDSHHTVRIRNLTRTPPIPAPEPRCG